MTTILEPDVKDFAVVTAPTEGAATVASQTSESEVARARAEAAVRRPLLKAARKLETVADELARTCTVLPNTLVRAEMRNVRQMRAAARLLVRGANKNMTIDSGLLKRAVNVAGRASTLRIWTSAPATTRLSLALAANEENTALLVALHEWRGHKGSLPKDL